MDSIKQAVEQQFSRTAQAYLTSAVHAGGADLARLVELAALTGREAVLDAGCGAGHTAAAVAPFAHSVVAFDLSQAMLDVTARLAAARGLANLGTRQGDVEAMPFADASFDVVTSRYSAHHWPHPQAALREIRRVLRSGGRFVLCDICSVDDFTVDTHLQAFELLRDPSHVRDHAPRQWLAMLAEAGFAAEVAWEFPRQLEIADWVARMETPAPVVAVLHAAMLNAPAEVRRALAIDATASHFTIPGALFVAYVQG